MTRDDLWLIRVTNRKCQRNVKLNVGAEAVSYREVQIGNGNAIGYCGAHLREGHFWEMDLGRIVQQLYPNGGWATLAVLGRLSPFVPAVTRQV